MKPLTIAIVVAVVCALTGFNMWAGAIAAGLAVSWWMVRR